jgi:hypothetical protein
MPERLFCHPVARCFPPGVPVYVTDRTAVLASRLARAWEAAWPRIDPEARDNIQRIWWWRWQGGCVPARVEVVPRLADATAHCWPDLGLFHFSYAECLEMPDELLPVLVAQELGHCALWAGGERGSGRLVEREVNRLCASWGFDVEGLDKWEG